MEFVQVTLDTKGYPIYIGENLLCQLKDYIKGSNKWMIITDTNIEHLYGEQIEEAFGTLQSYKFVVPAGEESKNIHIITDIVTELLKHKFTRQDKLIAFGGGVIGDLVGFCASIYMRGISFVQIPTTFLAQVDSSVGGKTGVNLPEAKNIIGSFHQPEVVLADTALLKTLPSREIISGLGEVIKYGIIEDYSFFKYISENLSEIISLDQQILPYIVKKCCEIKAEIVSQDEKEKGLRKNLNFGHTIGHAIETVTMYKTYTHGEAVLVGMFYETKMAVRLGLIDEAYGDEIAKCIQSTGISLDIGKYSLKSCIEIMSRDKKNKDERISFILPVGKGEVKEFLLSTEEIQYY